jgi:hypothetical protein
VPHRDDGDGLAEVKTNSRHGVTSHHGVRLSPGRGIPSDLGTRSDQSLIELAEPSFSHCLIGGKHEETLERWTQQVRHGGFGGGFNHWISDGRAWIAEFRAVKPAGQVGSRYWTASVGIGFR